MELIEDFGADNYMNCLRQAVELGDPIILTLVFAKAFSQSVLTLETVEVLVQSADDSYIAEQIRYLYQVLAGET
jgi:hypothetical protein